MFGVGWVVENRKGGIVISGAFGVRAVQPGFCVGVPEGSWKCHVYLLKSAVGDTVDGLEVSSGQCWLEGRFVAFQPAERAGYYYFVELVRLAGCGCQYHPASGARVLSEICLDFDDRLIEADVSMLDGCFGNVVQDLLVCRCDEEVV